MRAEVALGYQSHRLAIDGEDGSRSERVVQRKRERLVGPAGDFLAQFRVASPHGNHPEAEPVQDPHDLPAGEDSKPRHRRPGSRW